MIFFFLEALNLFLLVMSNKVKFAGLVVLITLTLLTTKINKDCLRKDSELREGMYLGFLCLQRFLGRVRIF